MPVAGSKNAPISLRGRQYSHDYQAQVGRQAHAWSYDAIGGVCKVLRRTDVNSCAIASFILVAIRDESPDWRSA